MKVKVRFTFGRTPLKLTHRALDLHSEMENAEQVLGLHKEEVQHLPSICGPERVQR